MYVSIFYDELQEFKEMNFQFIFYAKLYEGDRLG